MRLAERSLQAAVRRAILNLLSKLIGSLSPELLADLTGLDDSETIVPASLLVDPLTSVFANGETDQHDLCKCALEIIK